VLLLFARHPAAHGLDRDLARLQDAGLLFHGVF